MYKIIDFLFSYYVRVGIYGNRLHKNEFHKSYAYISIFLLIFGTLAITSAVCLNLNLGITFDKNVVQWIALIISSLVAGVFVYKARKEKFVENQLAMIEPKSDEEMKEYIIHALFTKFFPLCFYAWGLKFICRLLNVFIFNK